MTDTDSSTIGGGAVNRILDNSDASTIGGGTNNTVMTTSSASTIGGGRANAITVSSNYGGIASGYSNTVQTNANYSFIGGGTMNTVTNTDSATISGGAMNVITTEADASTIGGGTNNTINNNSRSSTISGGHTNTIGTGSFSVTIGGGNTNDIGNDANYATIGGGLNNNIAANGTNSAILGGTLNDLGTTTGVTNAVIGGGNNNNIADGGNNSSILGGRSNDIAAATDATIGGGNDNNIGASSTGATIGGGTTNNILTTATNSTISGGIDNNIGTAINAIVGGGNDNNIATGSTNSAILGGTLNDINGATDATIGGGNNNNIASGANFGAILGGASNNINQGTHNTISGGNTNSIGTGNNNAIIGGTNNIVGGNNSAVLGGINNSANGNQSFVWGRNSTAGNNSVALGDTATAADNEFEAKYPGGFVFTGEGTASGNNNFIATFHNRSTASVTGNLAQTTNAAANGIAIKIDATTTNISNDFVRFINGGGTTVGRIEGQTVAELPSDSEHLNWVRALEGAIDQAEKAVGFKTADLVIAVADLGIEIADIAVGSGKVAADISCAAGTLGLCSGPVAATTAELVVTIANVIKLGANVVNEGIQLGFAGDALAGAKKAKCDYDTMMVANIGVTYESGSADYAEWLPKAHKNEKFAVADIVGVKGGKISKVTDDAEQFMVISLKPIVLGNTPENGKAKEYEKVAFMGQVPVRVLGAVNLGDYILPSGNNNGLGIAVSPANMKPQDYKKIVGVAWSAGTNPDLNTIRVAVGLNTNSLAAVIEQQNQEIQALKQAMAKSDERFDQMNSALAMLVPGYKQVIKLPTQNVPTNNPSVPQPDYLDAVLGGGGLPQQQLAAIKRPSSITPVSDGLPSSSNNVNIPTHFFSDDVIKQAFAQAEEMMIKSGGNIDADPFFGKMKQDPAYREIAMKKVQNHLNKSAFDQIINNAKNTPTKN